MSFSGYTFEDFHFQFDNQMKQNDFIRKINELCMAYPVGKEIQLLGRSVKYEHKFVVPDSFATSITNGKYSSVIEEIMVISTMEKYNIHGGATDEHPTGYGEEHWKIILKKIEEIHGRTFYGTQKFGKYLQDIEKLIKAVNLSHDHYNVVKYGLMLKGLDYVASMPEYSK